MIHDYIDDDAAAFLCAFCCWRSVVSPRATHFNVISFVFPDHELEFIKGNWKPFSCLRVTCFLLDILVKLRDVK